MRATAATLGLATLLLGGGCDRMPLQGADPDYDSVELCGGRAVALHRVQGSGLASPLKGQRVVVEAVVIRNAVDTLGGIYLQDEAVDRDGDLATSEGLFIAIDGPPPRVASGDVVRAEGLVQERGRGEATQTTLAALSGFRVCGQVETLPEPELIEQPPLTLAGWERYEGMRVSIEAPLTVIDTGLLFRRGQLLLSFSGRQWQPTELFPPGEEARLLAARNAASRIIIDDADVAERPDTLPYLKRWPRAGEPLRAGSSVSAASGVLDQRDGDYMLYPEAALEIRQAARPAQPPAIDGRLRIVSYNLLNWFNGNGQGGELPTARGARDAQELARQRDKLLSALRALDADLYAVQEVENDGYGRDAALPQLASTLDRAFGRRRDPVALDPGVERLGGDEITVGFIYDQRTLAPAGPAAVLETPPFDQGRPALAQRFRELSSGTEFVAVVLHLKSKGGCDDARGEDADQGDGQACFNGQRRRAAQVLVDWLAGAPAGAGGVILLGDFNAYSREDPIRLLEQAGYLRAQGEQPVHSFLFRGEAGSLDHALLDATLAESLAGFGVWHINADEMAEADYRLQGRRRAERRLFQPEPWRSSDHDPLLLGLDLPPAAPTGEP